MSAEDRWFETYLDHARGTLNNDIPFPAEEVQVLTNGRKGEDTARHAIEIWETIRDGIRAVRPITGDEKVLDYGCGWGRMTRLLPFYFRNENIFGVDVDASLIDSARALVPALRHARIDSMRRLPFGDGSFDIVFANSVFSHLSADSALFTIGELGRVTRKGGIAVISTLEEVQFDDFYADEAKARWIGRILGDRHAAAEALSTTGFVWGDTRRWDNYGIAIMTDAWAKQLVSSAGFALVGSRRTADPESQNYKVCVKT